MANKELRINYTIPVGSYLKLGYRPLGSGQAFVQVLPAPFYNQTPFSVFLNESTIWEFELRQICEACPEEVSPAIYISETDI